MAILHVRNVPDDLYERLKKRAAAEHRSLSAEVVELLESHLPNSSDRRSVDLERLRELARLEHERASQMPIGELLETIRRTREALPLSPNAPDAVDLLREDRER